MRQTGVLTWETGTSSANSNKIPYILWNPNFIIAFYKRLPLFFIMSHVNPVHAMISVLLH